jgi:hypothetical protein
MNELNEESLQNLTFLDYLIYMRDYIQIAVYYKSKSHDAYLIAREIMRHIIKRYIKETKKCMEDYYKNDPAGGNLHFDEMLLQKYKTCKRDIDRREVILKFKKELNYDLGNMIRTCERTEKSFINETYRSGFDQKIILTNTINSHF